MKYIQYNNRSNRHFCIEMIKIHNIKEIKFKFIRYFFCVHKQIKSNA
jgi:hypothetical protein